MNNFIKLTEGQGVNYINMNRIAYIEITEEGESEKMILCFSYNHFIAIDEKKDAKLIHDWLSERE